MKPNYFSLLIAFLSIPLLFQPTNASDFYRWVDDKGIVHLTDSPSGVPEKYRNKAEGEEYKPPSSKSTVLDQTEGAGYSYIEEGKRRGKALAPPIPSGAAVQHYTDANFNSKVLRSRKLTMVEFWAIWCGPCRKIEPMISQLAGEYSGKVNIGKLDIDHNKKMTKQFGIKAIPTMLLFKNGRVVERLRGLRSIETLRQAIESKI